MRLEFADDPRQGRIHISLIAVKMCSQRGDNNRDRGVVDTVVMIEAQVPVPLHELDRKLKRRADQLIGYVVDARVDQGCAALDILLLFDDHPRERCVILSVEPCPIAARIACRPGIGGAVLVGNRQRSTQEAAPVQHSGQNVEMKTHAVLLGIFERPAAPSFGVEQLPIGSMLPESVANHGLDRLGRALVLPQWHLAHEVDVIGRLDPVADGPDDRSESERALRVDAEFTGASRIFPLVKPAANRLIAVYRVLILAGRDVDLAGDLLQKLRILRDFDGHDDNLSLDAISGSWSNT